MNETSAPRPLHACRVVGHEAATRFRMEPRLPPKPARLLADQQPPILSAAPLLASLELFQQARIERLRENPAR